MAIAQPASGDKLNSPDHSILHRIIAADVGATAQDLTVDASGNVTVTRGNIVLSAANATVDGRDVSAIIKNDGTVNPTNLLSNGDFENWSAGTSSAPDGWTNAYTTAREGTIVKIGTYSARISRSGAASELRGNYVHTAKGIAYWKGRTVTFGCWTRPETAKSCYLQIYDGVDASTSVTNSTAGSWTWLTVTRTIDNSATVVEPLCASEDGYFDGAMLVEGESAFAFSDKPAGYLTGTFTPTLTGFTVVGTAPAVNGRWTKVGNLVYFEITILAGAGGNTSIASVAASSYLSTLPFTPAYGATFGISNISMVSYGCGFVWIDSRIYTPVWSACTVSIYLSGTYRTA